MKREVQSIETVLNQFRDLTDMTRPDCSVIHFSRKDGGVTVSVCNGYIIGIATYKDEGPDVDVNLPPQAYYAVRYLNLTDVQRLPELLVEFYPYRNSYYEPETQKDWVALYSDMLSKAEQAKDNLIDMSLFKKAMPKSYRTHTDVKMYDRFVTLDYQIKEVKFSFLVLGMKRFN